MTYKKLKFVKLTFIAIIFILIICLTQNFLNGITYLIADSILSYFFRDTINSVLDSFLDLFNYPKWKKVRKI